MIPSELISLAAEPFFPVSLEELHGLRLMDRSDTKYMLPVRFIPDVLSRMNGSYRMLEISGLRIFPYHTTYLDTTDYIFFNQHVTGKLSRHKVRFRRYGQSGTTFLEVKKKTNKGRTVKQRIENYLNSDGSCTTEANEFIKKNVTYITADLKPVLLNSFSRITLAGFSVMERVTIDFNISFTDTEGNTSLLPSLAVVELKNESFSNRSRVKEIMKESGVYRSGFSKYCIGNALLKGYLRTNILKPNLIMINKIENGHH